MSDPASDSAPEQKKILRGLLEHEDELIGVRLGWLIAAESFLFGAYAVALTVSKPSSEPRFVQAAERLVKWLPVLGLVLAFLVYVSILVGFLVIRVLRKNWRDLRSPDPLDKFLGEGWLLLGFIGPLFVPPLIVAAWAYILVAYK